MASQCTHGQTVCRILICTCGMRVFRMACILHNRPIVNSGVYATSGRAAKRSQETHASLQHPSLFLPHNKPPLMGCACAGEGVPAAQTQQANTASVQHPCLTHMWCCTGDSRLNAWDVLVREAAAQPIKNPTLAALQHLFGFFLNSSLPSSNPPLLRSWWLSAVDIAAAQCKGAIRNTKALLLIGSCSQNTIALMSKKQFLSTISAQC
jgi:hypothetical protein